MSLCMCIVCEHGVSLLDTRHLEPGTECDWLLIGMCLKSDGVTSELIYLASSW